MLLALCGCGVTVPKVEHGFEFDMGRNSPDFEILQFRYGDGRQEGTSSEVGWKKFGKSPQSVQVLNLMPVGGQLSVKWKSRRSGKVFEREIDLTLLLPPDMKGRRIRMDVREGELLIYLKSPSKASKALPGALVEPIFDKALLFRG
ncbi:MAG: hypothetical protein GTO74_18870 [Hydrogenophaga sp.]|nr:hypothetical protein [Hydrogenophaga sp.]NIM43259.1 hypothetical protein [Hydrogenophaga sp.]NIN28327.1 hypothetical protein [Hydrogenophaga sp.]NIN29146.1 hypothetical protein [Hydrogenophaga sp.]NIO91888.1 hypothetical protein [Hydrogenophaga sp.]NIQ64118.1 hypothetical protein [Hydrogenophaga sp.]